MKKINLNIHMFIILNLLAITIVNDIIIYLTNLNYNYSLLLSLFFIAIISFFISKKHINIRKDFDKSDIIPIIVIILLSIIKLFVIDDFIDSITYHLYNQKHPFIDKINFDFLTHSAFFFPLGDRLNYIFVNFLGIRFGSILSCYIVLVLYYQFKNTLKIYIPNLKIKSQIIYSILFITSCSVAIYMGSYFIDLYSAVLLFELIYIFAQNINILKNKNYLYLSIFILGCSIGIKVTNLYLGFIIIAALIIKSIKDGGFKQLKNIRIYDYLLLTIIAVIPFIIYMINNYIQTGNPIFPLLNNVFNSIYYKDITGADTRLGPSNIFKLLLWPIYICFSMKSGNDIHAIIECTWGLGFIFTLYTVCTYKKQDKNFKDLALLVLILTYCWIIFISGYVRYGLVISYCFYIITIQYLNKICINIKEFFSTKNNPTSTLKLALYYALFSLIIICFTFYLTTNASYFIYHFDTIIDFNKTADYSDYEVISAPYDIDGVWLSSRYNNYYTDLIRNSEDPMYSLDIITKVDPMCKLETGYSEYAQDLFNKKTNNQSLYMAIPFNQLKYILKVLESNNMNVINILGIYNNQEYLNPYNYIFITQISKITN